MEGRDVNREKEEVQMKEQEVLRKKRRKRRRKKRHRKKGRIGYLFVILFLCVIWLQKTETSNDKNLPVGETNTQFLADVENGDAFLYEIEFADYFKEYSPEVLEGAKLYRRLKELAEEYEELKPIYENCSTYPERMLASLCNNPEMYEYVLAYPAYEKGEVSENVQAGLTEEEKKQSYPLFLQWDARWGYEEYGDFNIALSGCGPTTLAMAVVAINDYEDI